MMRAWLRSHALSYLLEKEARNMILEFRAEDERAGLLGGMLAEKALSAFRDGLRDMEGDYGRATATEAAVAACGILQGELHKLMMEGI